MNYYYFDTLPIHPQPEPDESLTGYLIRLAEKNHIKSINGLTVLCFPSQSFKLQKLADYPPLNLRELSRAANCSETRLLATTFHYLAKNFGRSTHPQVISRFLNGNIAHDLRYCPECLTESLYYRLTWRFSSLLGCTRHRCYLLNQCGYCGENIRLFSPLHKVGICPSCKGELKNCKTTSLDSKDLLITQNHYEDLILLLSQKVFTEDNDSVARVIGLRLRQWRQSRQLTRKDIADLIGLRSGSTLYGIENGKIQTGINFKDYANYVNALGSSLRSLFYPVLNETHDFMISQSGKANDEKQIQQRQNELGEDELVEKVNAAIAELRANGVRVSLRDIARLVGKSMNSLKRYPAVKEILQKIVSKNRRQDIEEQFQQRQNELVKKVNAAIAELRANGTRVSLRDIARLVGRSIDGLMHYPAVKEILQKIVSENRRQDIEEQFQQRQDELVEKVNAAIAELRANGTRVSLRGIARLVGKSVLGLKRYPAVREIFEQVITQNPKELVEEVKAAIAELRPNGMRVSQRAIARLMGKSVEGLMHYPAVKEILKKVVNESRKQDTEKQFQQRQDELVNKVNAAIKILKAKGGSVTQTKVSNLVGLSPAGLKRYPKVNIILQQLIQERRPNRTSSTP